MPDIPPHDDEQPIAADFEVAAMAPAITPATTQRASAPSQPLQADAASALGTWVDHHLYSLLASLGRLLRRPVSALLTIGVMGMALALPLGLWASLGNIAQLAGNAQASRQITVFLKPAVPLSRAQQLADAWRARPEVAALALKSPDDGLAELRRQEGMAEVIAAVTDNPLPSVLVLTPRGDESALAAALQALPEADLVQHDALWRQRLDGWLALGRRLALVLALLLGIGALLVVGNTVRLDIQSRREEIAVLQLLGATDGFIRRPFLYLGLWYGLGAGAVAIVLLSLAAFALQPAVAQLAASYGSGFRLQGLDATQAALAWIAAGLIGWLGAGIVTGHFLRQTRPDRH